MQNLSKRHSNSRKLWGVSCFDLSLPFASIFFFFNFYFIFNSSIFTEGNFCNAHELFTRDISIEYV